MSLRTPLKTAPSETGVSRGEGETLTVPKLRAVGLLPVCLTVKPVGVDIATSRMRRSVPSARILPLVASFLFMVRLGAGKGGRLQPHASEKALGGKNDVLY